MRISCRNDESLASASDSGIYTEDIDSMRESPRSTSKGDDPLSDPQVRRSLLELDITGSQLIVMSVKELNKRLVNCPSSMVDMLKRCRRTLKNRGYAKSCRVKRIAAKQQLEQINKRLVKENRELKQRNRSLAEQVSQLQNAAATCQEKPSEQSISCCALQAAPSPNFRDSNQINQTACKSDIERSIAPVDEHDSELLSLYEYADTYPSGVELDQIAQNISADGMLFYRVGCD